MKLRTYTPTENSISDWAKMHGLPIAEEKEYEPALIEFSDLVVNAFCPTGKGGGVKATCGKGAGKTAPTPSVRGNKPKSTEPIDSGKSHVADLKAVEKSTIKKIAGKLKAFGGSVGHAEHVATAFVKDKVGNTVSKLPGPVRKAVELAYAGGKLATKAAFVTWSTGQELAERISKEKGASPEKAKALRAALSTMDVLTMKPIVLGLESTGVGMAAAGAISFIPPATAGYLAHSAAVHPLATARAAKSMVTDGWKALKGHITKRAQKVTGNRLVRNDAESNARLVDAWLEKHNYDDWALALLLTAVDETQDVRQAMVLATHLYKQNPTDPTAGTEPPQVKPTKEKPVVTIPAKPVKSVVNREPPPTQTARLEVLDEDAFNSLVANAADNAGVKLEDVQVAHFLNRNLAVFRRSSAERLIGSEYAS